MSEHPVQQDAHPERMPAIRALRNLAVALIVSSVVGAVVVPFVWNQNNGYSGRTPAILVVAQIVGGLTPSMLTGGIVCAGLALAVFAMPRVLAAVRPVEPSAATDPGSDDAAQARDAAAPVARADADPRPVDVRAYMRPRGGSDPS